MRLEPREFKWPFSAMYSFFARVMNPVYEELVALMEIPQGAGRLLEIGGGDGRLAVILAERTNVATIVTTDVSEDMIKRAASRAELSGLSQRINAEVQNVHNLTYPDNSFDVVISSFSLHHWKDPVKGLRECARVLKKGGKLIIIDGDHTVSLKEIREAVNTIKGSSALMLGLWVGRYELLDYTTVAAIVKKSDIGWLSVDKKAPLLMITGSKI